MPVRSSRNVLPDSPRGPQRPSLRALAVVAVLLLAGVLLLVASQIARPSRAHSPASAAGGMSSARQPTPGTATVAPGGGVTSATAPGVRSSSATRTGASVGRSARLQTQPTRGANGAMLTVTGSGWQPGAPVRLEYRDPAGTPTGAAATAMPDDAGKFSAQLVALDPTNTPGPHQVFAGNGRQSSTVAYLPTP